MDFSKVDWMHVLGWTTLAAVAGPAVLGAAGLTAGLTALGFGVTGAGLGVAVGAVSAVNQAKGAATAVAAPK